MAAVAVAVGLVLWHESGWKLSTGRAVPRAMPLLRWIPEGRQAYRVRTQVVLDFAFAGAEAPARQEACVSGRLDMRVLRRDGDAVRVVFQLAGGRFAASPGAEEGSEMQLGLPFVAIFAPDGRPRGFEFPPGLPAAERQILEHLIRTFQVVIPAHDGRAWSTTEENGTGLYRASYVLARDGSIQKAKRSYEAVTARDKEPSGCLTARVRDSRSTIRLAPVASWLETVTIEESTDIRVDGRLLVSSRLSGLLERLPSLPDPQAALFTMNVDAPLPRAPSPPPPAPLDAHAAAGRLAEIVGQIDAGGERNAALLHELRDLLRASPDVARRLPQLIRDGTLNDGTTAALLNVLELAGTAEAQAALGSILEDAGFGRLNRLRAAIALGAVEAPDDAAFASLRNVAGHRESEAEEELSNTSILAIGNLAKALRAQDAARAEAVGADLARRLDASSDPGETGILLGALGNVGDVAHVPAVRHYLDSPDAYVRSSAAGALGRLGGSDADAALAARLDREVSGQVRASIVAAMNRFGAHSDSVLSQVDRLILQEDDATARLEMAKLLGQSLDSHPSSRQALETVFRREKSRAVRSYLASVLLEAR